MQTDPISAAKGYQLAFRRILKATTLHEARKLASDALDITFIPAEPGVFSTYSGYGHDTQQPFVTIGMANPTESANPIMQISTKQARDLALRILEAADAAESDGFVIEWLGNGPAKLSEQQAATLLNDFRAYRERLRGGESEE